MERNKIILLLIFVLGLFLRFILISNNPPLLNWDEAAFGYNAFSLGIDGRDEFGRSLPIDYLESFGDYKPPVYAYLDVIPVKLLGLNSFSVRLPSALFGSLAIIIAYFLVKEIFKTKQNKESLALISALLLSISPWHIMLSRGAFEANIASFFIMTGTLFFLRFVNGKKWDIIFSSIFFLLSIYTFNTARIVAPALAVVLGIIFIKEIWKNRLHVVLSFIFTLIFLVPIVPFLLSPQASLRYNEVNIFSDPTIVERSNKEIANDGNTILSKIVHNRRVLFAESYLKHYLDNFNYNFLFIRGDINPRFSTQDVGQLYMWEIPFILVGIIMLIRKKEGYYFLIPIIIFIGVIPAAFARETPHALRIENVLPYYQILSAYGVLITLSEVAKRKKLFIGVLGLVIVLNCAYFLHGLFLHYPKEYSGEWQYGYKESVSYVKENYYSYDKFVITDQLGRPYIYYLYLTNYDPQKFRENAKIQTDAFGFVNVQSFDKYQFTRDPKKVATSERTLFIDIPNKVPKGAKVLKTFYLLNGDKTLVAYVR